MARARAPRSAPPPARPRPAAPQPSITATWAAPAVVVAAALLAYANSLANGFVWDDPIILTRQLVVFDSLRDVLLPPRGIPQYSPDYYRPLTVLSLLIDRALGGGQPFAFHLSVVLAHAGVALLVFALARQLLRGAPGGDVAALVAGALFAVHPIHSESVAWAAGRSDVLATGFLLAALCVHGGGPISWFRSAATGLCVAAALGAKETGIAVFPLLLLRDGLALRLADLRARPVLAWMQSYAGALVALVVYFLLRRATIGELVGAAPGEAEPGGLLPQIAGAVGAYLFKLLWPVGLNAYIDAVPASPAWLALTAVLVLGAAGLGVQLWRRAQRVPVFALLWIGLTLLPSLSIVWKIPEAPMAERYLYLPSVGFCLLVGWLAGRAWSRAPAGRRRVLAALLAVGLLVSMAGTIQRNRVWRDDVSLWEDTAAKSQVSGMALRSLATAYQKQGRVDDARRYFEQALGRRNSQTGLQIVHNNLGTLAMSAGNFAEAERQYRHALEVNPNAADSVFNLGLAILQGGGRTPAAAARAAEYFARARALSPLDADTEAALGQTFAIRGDRAQAIAHLRRSLELGLNPTSDKSVRALIETLEAEAR